jgi:SAM-dependent methyltransferase
MPETTLPDLFFDLVLSLEIIAELPKEDHRLFFAEAARILKPDGYLVCSSGIDIDTEGGVEKLIELALTEFDIVDELESYHALSIKLKRFLEAPSLFIDCWKNKEQRAKELSLRRGFNKGWLWISTTPLFIWPWFIFEPCTRPLLRWIKNSSRLMHILERITRFTSDRNGISHFLFIAKKRPLQKINPKDIPIQKPGRKQVWE